MRPLFRRLAPPHRYRHSDSIVSYRSSDTDWEVSVFAPIPSYIFWVRYRKKAHTMRREGLPGARWSLTLNYVDND